MRIAFTGKGTDAESMIDPRFGRTDYIVVYEEETEQYSSHDNREIEGMAHGAGPQTAQKLFELKPDVLITGNGPGGNAATALQAASLKIFVGAGGLTVKEAYEAYRKGELKEI